jgi:hypothetical protein
MAWLETFNRVRCHHIVVNWRTSLMGVAMIFTAIGDILNQLSTGHLDGEHLLADVGAITGGVGLIFAKDAGAHDQHN